jgi:hypothetical protein
MLAQFSICMFTLRVLVQYCTWDVDRNDTTIVDHPDIRVKTSASNQLMCFLYFSCPSDYFSAVINHQADLIYENDL